MQNQNDILIEKSNVKCDICNQKNAKYICPQCSINYCSVPCYNSKNHFTCYERFCKKNVQVLQSLNDHFSNEKEIHSKKKLVLILNTHMEKNSNDNIAESHEWKYVVNENVKNIIDEIKQTYNMDDVHKSSSNFLKILNESNYESDDRSLKSEEEEELVLLINSASTEQLLNILTSEEKKKFDDFLIHENYVIDDKQN